MKFQQEVDLVLTFLRATENISLIFAAPLFSLSVNSAPEAKTKGKPPLFERDLANNVLPVPGGPKRRIPYKRKTKADTSATYKKICNT